MKSSIRNISFLDWALDDPEGDIAKLRDKMMAAGAERRFTPRYRSRRLSF